MRDAKSLAGALLSAEEAARALGAAGLTSAHQAALDSLRDFCMINMNPVGQSGLELADREDTIAAWLKAHGVNKASAEDLARTPITMEGLDRLGRDLPGPTLDAALRWIAGGCAARALVVNIERAASRIHALVAAVKGFTHMDRALDQEIVDIPGGLADTVALLAGKANAKSVATTLHVAPELPHFRGNSVEVNQIWMNLIDNAIDAAPVNGHVTVTAAREGANIVVRVLDDGPGIHPDIKESIFDPFFTTKAVGEGTGLGLDIVRRIVQWHKGEIEVDSQPGQTEFRIRLPVASSE
jgi:signal transduction histidine kinase